MKKRIIALFTTVFLVVGCSFSALAENSGVSEDSKKELIRYILFNALQTAKEDVDSTELFLDTLMKLTDGDDEKYNDVLRAFTESIDEYGEYYTQEEVNAVQTDLTGVSGGIGATVEMSNGKFRVVNVLPSSASENAGVMAGWQILNVDGVSMEGKSLYGALAYVRGDIGTDVNIDFLTNDGDVVNLTLTRGQIDVASISYAELANTKNPVGYIKIDNFSETTGSEVKTALEEFNEKKIDNLILDLRYNGGGVLDGALEVASCFLKKGAKIVTVEPKNEKEAQTYTSTGAVYDGNLVILMNEYTASASEVVAGALTDNKRAVTVGWKTFGKGTVQTIRGLPLYGGLFKFTTAHYKTPNGTDINKVGITPDYKVSIVEYRLDQSEVPEPVKERKFNLGDSGEDVKVIKEYMTKIGYSFENDDTYDEETKEAVKNFQKNHELYSYGICDFTTQDAIREALLNTDFYDDLQLEKAIELADK